MIFVLVIHLMNIMYIGFSEKSDYLYLLQNASTKYNEHLHHL
jgi:hypothetical protein